MFKVDKSFRTKSSVTERTIKVVEAFGIGIDDEKKHQVYHKFEVDINLGDIVYITGESGSGKSVLLRELVTELRESAAAELFGCVTQASELKIPPEEILVDSIGSDINEALRYLSLAGLNDAFLFVRRYRELSDGQKYRYKVAKMLASDAGVWVLDEFAATLDRETAKIVAFCLQKVARRTGRTVILATTHEDLFEDLCPSVLIRKEWGEDVTIRYFPNRVNKVCSLTREVKIRAGLLADYKKLSYLHYRGGTPWGVKKVFIMELNGRNIGAIIYSVPPLHISGRTRFLGYSPKSEEVNRDFLIISRIVIHPKFRSIGLGTLLVKDTLPLAGSKYVETIAVMARYNPFFAKAGMLEIPFESTMTVGCQKILEKLRRYGFNPAFCSSEAYNQRVLGSLDKQAYNELTHTLTENKGALYIIFNSSYRHKIPSPQQIQDDLTDTTHTVKIIRGIAIRAQPKKYYIWPTHNPKDRPIGKWARWASIP